MRVFWIVVGVMNWAAAVGWTWKSAAVWLHRSQLFNLREERYGAARPARLAPAITVVVPARNEEADIENTLRSLVQQTVSLHVIAVDDRSTDRTGAIMDAFAAQALPPDKQVTVLHVSELPAGWMGKNHALALAARSATTDWLLFTDADVIFAPDAIQRSLNFAEGASAGHFVLLPTPIMLSFGERMMMSFFQIIGLVTGQFWRIPDPSAPRRSIGIGAFNMIRREVYQGIGGFESLRMEVLEDLRLGRRVKECGYRQAVAHGRDLIRLRWATSALGIANNLTKNAFAVFQFRVLSLLGGCAGLLAMSLLPLVGLFGPRVCQEASLLTALVLFLLYRFEHRYNDHSAGYFLTFPIAGVVFAYGIVRSMWITLRQGGVMWRGTFYPLAEVRRFAGPVR